MNTTQALKHGLIAVLLALLMGLSGCAHLNPRDPLEPFNRGVYAFNDGLDTVVLKPLAQGYRAVLPQFVRTGIGNFFSNLDDITVFFNNVLQLKIPQAASDAGRFLVNSTIGLLGLIDVATHFGLEKHNEDFGQTMGYWGIGSGPYLVLPLLGPSSFRDALGRWADSYTDVVWREDHIRTRNQFVALRAVDTRSRLLATEKVLETAAIDEYSFVRDAYLQRRRNLVFDGNPPPEKEDDEPAQKPRTDAEPQIRTVVLDQFGQLVAGGDRTAGGIAPLLAEETSKPLAQHKAPVPDSRIEEAAQAQAPSAPEAARPQSVEPPPAAQPAAASEERTPDAPARVESPLAAQVPIVRVWLR